MSAALIDAIIYFVDSLVTSFDVRSEAKAAEEQAKKLAEEAEKKAEEEALAAKKKLEDGTVWVPCSLTSFIRVVHSRSFSRGVQRRLLQSLPQKRRPRCKLRQVRTTCIIHSVLTSVHSHVTRITIFC